MLTTTAANEVDVWNTDNPTASSTPLLGGSGQTSQVTWTVGTDTIPTTVYVGATAGSASVGDILFTLAINPGSSPPGPSATTQPATAVQINSLVVSDANNPENTVTATDNSGSASVIAMADQSTGEASINLSVNVTPQSLVGQQNMLWEVIDQSTGQVVNGGTFNAGSFDGLTLRPTSHDDSTYTVEVGFAGPGQTTLQPNQVTQSATLYVVTTDPDFEIAGVAGEDSGSVTVQHFYDPNPNAMTEELAGPITIDWGDGDQGSGTIQYVGDNTYAVMGDHTYTDGGSYTINITISTLSSSSSSSSNDGQIQPAAIPTAKAIPPAIYVINNPALAHGKGHAAIIIPNSQGCLYLTYDDSNTVTTCQFNNINDAIAAAKLVGYTRYEDWNCTTQQASSAMDAALAYNNTEYYARTHNCWDMVYDALVAAGEKVQMISNSGAGDIPNDNFRNNEKYANGYKDPM